MFFEAVHSLSENEFITSHSKKIDFPIHIHRSFEYFEQISGSTQVCIGEKSYTLTQGEAILVFPLQTHSYTCIEEGKLRMCIFSPDLVACNICGEYESGEMWLDVAEGQLYCEACAPRRGEASVLVSNGVLAAMRHIVYAPFERLYSFTLPADSAKELSKISEMFVRNQTERRFNTLDFYHSLEV